MMFSQLGWQLALESSLIAYSLPLTQVERRLHTALPALLWVPRPAMDIDGYRWMRLFKCVTLQSANPATFPVESSPRDGILKIKRQYTQRSSAERDPANCCWFSPLLFPVAPGTSSNEATLHTWPIGSLKNPSREIFTLGRGTEWYITLPRNFEKCYPL